MPALTIPDLPEPVYRRLRERADRHRRSLDAEAAALLEMALPPPTSDPDDDPFIAEAEAADAWFDGPLPDLIAEGKRAGRKYEDDLPPHLKPEEPSEANGSDATSPGDHAGER